MKLVIEGGIRNSMGYYEQHILAPTSSVVFRKVRPRMEEMTTTGHPEWERTS